MKGRISMGDLLRASRGHALGLRGSRCCSTLWWGYRCWFSVGGGNGGKVLPQLNLLQFFHPPPYTAVPATPTEVTAVKFGKAMRGGASGGEAQNEDGFQVGRKRRVNVVGGSKDVQEENTRENISPWKRI